MKKEIINGVSVPYDKSTEELEKMLFTGSMSDFVVACEALSYKTDEKSFELLKNYITDKDKNKRLCILKTIFRHRSSKILKNFLEESILSNDIWFAENGLKVAFEYEFDISDNVIFTAIKKHIKNLYSTSLYVLNKTDVNETNFLMLVELFRQTEVSSQKEVLGKILFEKYTPEKARELFDLFSNDDFSKVRLLAVRIGKKYCLDIETLKFDADGHVRKEATK